MFDIRHISRVAGAAASGVLAVGLMTAPGGGVNPSEAQVRKGHSAAVAVAVPTVAAGDAHTCALRANGTVKCWGFGYFGALGNGTGKGSDTPVPVRRIRTATAITAGYQYACAVLADGTVKCWGQNWGHQLGRTDLRYALTPVRVTRVRQATAIAAGDDHTCALLSDGTVKCWGYNEYGQLGNGTFSPTFKESDGDPLWAPASAWMPVKGIRNATAIAAGGGYEARGYTCAILSTGTVQCWGSNEYGQLGNGTRTDIGVPTPVSVKGIRNATAIAAGARHACAVLSTGTVECWGRNRLGQLGDGSQSHSRPVPVRVKGIRNATAITAGYSHTCALLADRTVMCWGGGGNGQLGNGTLHHAPTPVPVKHIRKATAVGGGGELPGFVHTCALLATGAVQCWGDNSSGQLGN
ncbi:MAG: hypothetical protein MUE31_01655, partial [Candidatus Nanopelagicales bacterium]|nr:hypothetical protein [Candidatus Nanopelagicales bacterium]